MWRYLLLKDLLLLFCTVSALELRCPAFWYPRAGSDKCYYFSNKEQSYTWAVSREICQSRGGDLVTIKDVNEKNWIIHEAGNRFSSQFWIGLNSATKNYKCLWVDKSTLNTAVTPWASGYPMSSIFWDYLCVSMNAAGKISNLSCDRKIFFVCERSISKPLLCDYDANWEHVNNKCYKYFADELDWESAWDECLDNGADIIVVNNEAEKQFLEDKAKSYKKTLWLGFSNMYGGDYFWILPRNSSYNNWAVGEPKPSVNGTGQERCGNVPAVGTQKWITSSCSSEYSFICEHIEGICAIGWIAYRQSCYQFNFAQVYSRTWQEANKTCVDQGAQLLIIDDEKEQNYINYELNDIEDVDSYNPITWIGLSDINSPTRKVYKWVDGSTPADKGYLNWETSTVPGVTTDNNCIYIPGEEYDPKWMRANCKDLYSFICEAPIGAPITSPHSTHAPLYCSEKWLQFGDYCYNFIKTTKMWPAAENDCITMGAHLTSITTQAENTWISSKLEKDSWIGLNDRIAVDQFVWTDGSPFSYKNWNYGEPNNGGNTGRPENCVNIMFNGFTSYTNGKWNDHFCDELAPYVCKKKADIDPTITPSILSTTPWSVKCGAYWLEDEYSHNCYRYDLQALSWDDANTHCKVYGGSLVSIISLSEQRFVNGLRTKAVLENPNILEFWIGFTDRGTQGKWYWFDKQPASFFNWQKGNPSNLDKKNCVAASAATGYWSNMECEARRPYFCKKSVAATPIPTTVTYPPTLKPDQSYMCQSGWKEYSNECFYFSKEKKKTWNNAQLDCSSRYIGSNLASIKSIAEQRFIDSNLYTYNSTEKIWIGLNDLDIKFEFHWNDGSPVTYTNWKKDDPKHNSNAKEDCVNIYREIANLGGWSDDVCTKLFYYICRGRKILTDKTTITTPVPGCNKDEYAFDYSCYKFIPTKMTWTNATSYCKKMMGRLLDIENRFEQSFLNGKLALYTDNHWIGLNSQDEVGLYKWASGRPVTFTHWDENQPSATEKQCVSMTSGRLPGFWQENNCDTMLPSICEKPRSGYTQPIIPTTTIPPLKCPSGWVERESFCYLNYYYTDKKKMKTFNEARVHCQTFGADLISIHSSDENYFVYLSVMASQQTGYTWIGLRAENGSSDKWVDKTATNYFSWNTGEPNHNNGLALCVEYAYRYWKHTNCETLRNWICKASKSVLAASSIQPELTTSGITTTTSTSVCGETGWNVLDGNCFYFSAQKMSWHDAEEFCQTKSSSLASINSPREQSLLTTKVAVYSNPGFWIGLNALQEYQIYQWSDGNPLTYTHWASGEPNDGGGEEACVTIYSANGFWNDDHCAKTQEFICKKFNSSVPSIIPPVTPEPVGNCEPTWMQFGKKCYKFFGQATNDTTTWQNARDACMRKDTRGRPHLVSIHSELEQLFITTKVLEAGENAWIGFSSLLNSWQWNWIDNTKVDFVYWNTNQPGYTYYSCAGINTASKGRWMSESCSMKKGFVCQRAVDPYYSTPAPPSKCPLLPTSDFIPFGDSCFYIPGTAHQWNDARDICERSSKGKSFLASIINFSEESFIRYTFPNQLKDGLWLGLSSDKKSNTFHWTNNYPVVYTNWGVGQPTNNEGEGCVMIKENGKWNNTQCNYLLRPLCKIGNVEHTTYKPVSEGSCPTNVADWFPSQGEFCYLYRPDVLQNFYKAVLTCEQLRGTIASFDSLEEFDYVMYLLQSLTKGPLWIGLIMNQGKVSWYDNSALSFTKWKSNTTSTAADYCVFVNDDNYWDTRYCYNTIGFICKVKKVIPETISTSPSTVTTKTSIITTIKESTITKVTETRRTPTKTVSSPTAQGLTDDNVKMGTGSIIGISIGTLLALLGVILIVYMLQKKYSLSIPKLPALRPHSFNNELYFNKETQEVTIQEAGKLSH